MGNAPGGLSPGEVVRRFFASTVASDMAAWTHPDAVLHPLSRPGRSVYFGRDGVAEMLADMHDVHGRFDIVCDDVDERDEGVVVARGRLVLENGNEFERICEIRVRDGLVVRFDPVEWPERSDAARPSGV
jgi:hypothetical protein